MGGRESTHRESPPPPTRPMFDTPWRELPWGNNDSGLQYVKDYQPQNDEVQQLRVLLYGPVGFGKSSFISSVSTVLRRRIATPAEASSTTSVQSHTKQYKTHKIPNKGRGNFYPFVFSDIMGLEEGSGRGVDVEDLKKIMKGHVKDGYKFNPVSPLSPDDPHYISSPTMEDRVHVLVCVQSANAAQIKDSVLQKMKEIRGAASDLGIPQIALITKIDEACKETKEDLKNVYKSKYVKKKMSDLSAFLGIPMNCILPVKNYSEEINLKDDLDTMILSALKLMLDLGDDFICELASPLKPPPQPPSKPRPPSPSLRSPWRELPWGNNESDLQYVKDYHPQNDEVQHIRVLIYGPVGAGKSSFISSVSAVLRRRMTTPAKASSTTSDQSFTRKYKTHKIPKEGKGNFYPFAFTDIMGLEEGSGRGVSVEDIKLIMKGHVKDGYKFNPVSPLSPDDPHYNPSPSLEDRVHVLVCVQSANAPEIKGSVLQKLEEIRKVASDLDIPQIALITKIDEACDETEKDLKNVYKSKYVKKKMEELSAYLGIPMNCIFPVKNYSQEINLKDDVDTLILSALRLMLDLGDDFICDL